MELNFISFLIIALSIYFIFGFDTNFKALIISELFWISLYVFSLLMAIMLDDVNVLSLIFFFLIFSAVDISIGLILIILQKKVLTLSNTNSSHNNNIPYFTRKIKSFITKTIKI